MAQTPSVPVKRVTASSRVPKVRKAAEGAQLQPLSKLLLDSDNPRFGGEPFGLNAQRDILDHIVRTFGVGDVISSLAVNGYFRAEPVVGRTTEDGDKIVIVEGNRRLAACLILSGDARAANQTALGVIPKRVWDRHHNPAVDPIPVITFGSHQESRELLSYLGVRHISSSAPWDSYAKAVWVSRVVETAKLSVSDVAQMVGDQHRTVARLLEGYYVVKQAENSGQFRPLDSQKSGRGSVTAYPFSWVYTILGYATTRIYLGLTDIPPEQDPVPPDKVSRLGILFKALFGSKAEGRSSAVSDSRELGDLASILASSEKVALLERGMSISEIVRSTRPLDERLRIGLAEVRQLQQQLISGLSEQEFSIDVAAAHIDAARINRRGAVEIFNRLNRVANPDDE